MGRTDPVVGYMEPRLGVESASCRLIVFLFLALALVRGVLYSVLIPPWQAPDEPQHYQMVRLIGDLGHVPSLNETCQASETYQVATVLHAEVVQSLRDNRFWEYRHRHLAPDLSDSRTDGEILHDEKLTATIGHPPIYYVLASLALYPFRSSSLPVHLYVLRGLSVLLSIVTVWCVFTVGNWLSLDERGQRSADLTSRTWAATLFAVFLPMHTFMSAAVNNDALAEMLASVTLTLVIWCCSRRFSYVHIITLIVLLLLGLFTKRTVLFLLPLVLGFLAWKSPNQRIVGSASYRPSGNTALLARLVRSLTTFWVAKIILFLVILTIVYILAFDGATQKCWDLPVRTSQLIQADRYTSDAPNHYGIWVLLGFASFWGNFGWMNIPLDVAWYVALAVLTLGAMLGALRGARRVWLARRENPTKCCVMIFCALAVLLVFAQSGASMIVRQMPPQGRYLFPAMVPIALGFTWGLFEWVPVRYHRLGLGVSIVSLILFDLVSMLGYVLPYFYG